MKNYNFWIYIITNPNKTVLYIGVTNNLSRRLDKHYQNRGIEGTFAGKYHCYNLIYFEEFNYIDKAIAREKQLKRWSRNKKVKLIESKNPDWKFLNTLFPYKGECDYKDT